MDYWETAKKKVMADTNLFLDRLLNYDKENMTEAMAGPPPPSNAHTGHCTRLAMVQQCLADLIF